MPIIVVAIRRATKGAVPASVYFRAPLSRESRARLFGVVEAIVQAARRTRVQQNSNFFSGGLDAEMVVQALHRQITQRRRKTPKRTTLFFEIQYFFVNAFQST